MLRIFICSVLFFCSCAGIPKNVPVPNHREPKKSAKVYYPKNWNINSEKDLKDAIEELGASTSQDEEIIILDLKGGILDGSKQKGGGNQDENQEPLFRANIPLIIKNGFVRNNKNAATFAAKNSGLEKVTFTNIGEDAVATSRKATNFSLKNCEFINKNDGDKSVQLNQAENASIEGNLIYGGITGIRVHESSWTDSNTEAFCRKNEFVGVDTAWNVSKGVLVVEEKNSYKNVNLPFKISKGGKIKNADGKIENE